MRAKELAILLRVLCKERNFIKSWICFWKRKITINKRGRYEAVRTSSKDREKGRKDRQKQEDKKEKKGKKEEKNRKKKDRYLTGTFIGHPRGFGFVELSEEDGEDVYIPEEETGGAFHGDQVQILLKKDERPGKRREGRVVKILERGMEEIVGTFQESSGFGFVVPDNQRFLRDIFIQKENFLVARDEDKVVVRIRDYGTSKRSPEGKIVEVLGSPGEKGIDGAQRGQKLRTPHGISGKGIKPGGENTGNP